MQGLMQDWPLLISRLLDHATRFHGTVEVVSEMVEGTRHRYTYTDLGQRSKQLAKALKGLGVKPSDCVGTLAWNNHRHLELWYAISGSGAICHTINPRLFPKQIAYIINHAEDKVLFFDLTFLPLVRGLEEHLKTIKTFVMMTDRSNMPKSLPENYLCFEDLVAAENDEYDWPEMDENTAASLCYTSGTTGNPKGVLYSHRSTILHAMAVTAKDSFGLSASRPACPIVPMFHANAWGYPYACLIAGCKMVLNGPKFDGESIVKLFKEEGVMVTAGVPTIWMGVLEYLKQSGEDLGPLKGLGIGGSAAPPSMIEAFEAYGVWVHHAWGMTETSPVGTMGSMSGITSQWPQEKQIELKSKQGRGMFAVELKIVDEAGVEAPWDGKTFGHLMVRGPWIASRYFKSNDSLCDKKGWFDSGDVATIDENGFMEITDRAKDVIKSGGEWISSIDLENTAVSHPDIAAAAVI
ncbi:MAG: AMP-binding protein, partial [Sphingomonadales bacterium]